MKLHKLFHLLALLALIACAPVLGPSTATPTTAPRPVAVLSTVTPTVAAVFTWIAPGIDTAAPTPTATLAPPPSPSSPPADTATPAASATPSQPQWGHQTKTAGCQAQGPYPNPACTPGDIFPNVTGDQVCVSGYSSSVRNVPASEKDAVYAEYGIASHTAGEYEVDHFVPLELGGSNDLSNLWPEPASPPPGFHQKDAVENALHDQVCRGALTLAEAQSEIATDWLAVYQSLTAGAAPLPSPTRVRITFTPAPAGQPISTPTGTQRASGSRVRDGALCNDGSSSTATGSGACSNHQGVQCWNYSDGTCTKP